MLEDLITLNESCMYVVYVCTIFVVWRKIRMRPVIVHTTFFTCEKNRLTSQVVFALLRVNLGTFEIK